MYTLIYTKTTIEESDQYKTPDSAKVYYCKKKKLASHYLATRFYRIAKNLCNKKDIKITSSFIAEDNEWAYIEYETGKTEYPYTREEFYIVRGSEILDLPNGPSLRVE